MPLQHLDRRLPAWLDLGGEYRLRVEASVNRNYRSVSDTYLLSQLRLWMVLRPLRWLTVAGEAQDARVFFNQLVPSAGSFQNTWDFRQAYVELGDARKSPLTFTAGRQILSFGDERLIGPSDWLNMGRTFDAVRLDLRNGPDRVSVFASSVIVIREGLVDHHLEGNNLHGVYGSLHRVIPRAALEPYVFWRLAPRPVRLSENAGLGALDEVTFGVHLKGKLPRGFEYGTEMARQTGSLGSRSIRTWAGEWLMAKTFTDAAWQPRVFAEANYASGTQDPRSREWGTFDQLYPSSHDKLGFADQIGWRNIEQVRAGVEEKLGRHLQARQTYESFWLASTHDALYASNGAIAVAAQVNAAGRHVGQELDFVFAYAGEGPFSAGCGYAHLFAGEFLKRATAGNDYGYPYAFLQYRF